MPDTDRTYNGWTNYETWLVKLWMDNEEPSYRFWQEATREAWREAEHGGNPYTDDRRQRARILLVEQLKDTHADAYPELRGFAADLLSAALADVNWHEIADHLLDDAQEAGDLAAAAETDAE